MSAVPQLAQTNCHMQDGAVMLPTFRFLIHKCLQVSCVDIWLHVVVYVRHGVGKGEWKILCW